MLHCLLTFTLVKLNCIYCVFFYLTSVIVKPQFQTGRSRYRIFEMHHASNIIYNDIIIMSYSIVKDWWVFFYKSMNANVNISCLGPHLSIYFHFCLINPDFLGAISYSGKPLERTRSKGISACNSIAELDRFQYFMSTFVCMYERPRTSIRGHVRRLVGRLVG